MVVFLDLINRLIDGTFDIGADYSEVSEIYCNNFFTITLMFFHGICM